MAPRSTKKRHGPRKSEGDEESESDSTSESSDSRDPKEYREEEDDDEQGGSTDDELSDEEGTDEDDDEEEEEQEGAKAVKKVGKQKRGSRRKRKNARDVDPSKGNIYSLKNEFRGKGIGWNICDACGQATSVELPYGLAKGSEKWNCSMNVWNPFMSKCSSEREWEKVYNAFMEKRKLTSREWIVQGKKVNKWWLYNTVTQMGGWETVKYNGWLPLLYDEMALTVTDAGNRLKRIYESDLYEFEQAHFKGRRYANPEERLRLFRDTEPQVPEIAEPKPNKKDQAEKTKGKQGKRVSGNLGTSKDGEGTKTASSSPAACRKRSLTPTPLPHPGHPPEASKKAKHEDAAGALSEGPRCSGSSPASAPRSHAACYADRDDARALLRVCGHDHTIVCQYTSHQHRYPVVYRSGRVGYCGKWCVDKHLAEEPLDCRISNSQKAWVVSRLLNNGNALPRYLLVACIKIATKGMGKGLAAAEAMLDQLPEILRQLEAEGVIILQNNRLELQPAVAGARAGPLPWDPLADGPSRALQTLHKLPCFEWQGFPYLRVSYVWHGHGFTGVWDLDQQVELKPSHLGHGTATRQGSCMKAWVVNYVLHCDKLAAEHDSIIKAAAVVCKAMATAPRQPHPRALAPLRTDPAGTPSVFTIIRDLEEEGVLCRKGGAAGGSLWQVHPHYIDTLAHALQCQPDFLNQQVPVPGVQKPFSALGPPRPPPDAPATRAAYGPGPSGPPDPPVLAQGWGPHANACNAPMWIPSGKEECAETGAITIASKDQGVVSAIDQILGHGVRSQDGAIFFRVKWRGLDEQEATWESESSLTQTAGPLVNLYWSTSAHRRSGLATLKRYHPRTIGCQRADARSR
uniref:Chromo domain-containing protein n=1 Tax=Eutreptiella gymnastica TaxID=73025 RepID=A0A7S1I4R5_9EUGL|mmetsp:Transcript_130415/g.225472  ORF Transcript_130415/g.225472 Transcript_130415/m.225472 type:complete len:856 (+) Transcript_130415:38-2605(+)